MCDTNCCKTEPEQSVTGYFGPCETVEESCCANEMDGVYCGADCDRWVGKFDRPVRDTTRAGKSTSYALYEALRAMREEFSACTNDCIACARVDLDALIALRAWENNRA